jgi:hypothetical protein
MLPAQKVLIHRHNLENQPTAESYDWVPQTSLFLAMGQGLRGKPT